MKGLKVLTQVKVLQVSTQVKGLQVAPAELEDVLRGLDGDADVAVSIIAILIMFVCLFVHHRHLQCSPQVIGIPDERSGQVPRAYIVREESLTEKEVM